MCRLGAGRGSEGCGAGRRMGGGGVLSGVGGAVMLGVVSPVVVSLMVAAVVARSVTQGEAYEGGHEERAEHTMHVDTVTVRIELSPGRGPGPVYIACGVFTYTN